MQIDFTLKILTPFGEIVAENVDYVEFPSSDGQIGILPGHCNIAGVLGTGRLRYMTTDNRVVSMSILEGVFRFGNNTLSLLTDKAEICV